MLPQQAKLLLHHFGGDAVPGAAIDEADEGNPFLCERLFDEQVRLKVRILVTHDCDDGHHAGVGGVINGIHQVEHRLLPRGQRVETHEVFPRRVGEHVRVHRSRSRTQGHIPIRPFQAELPRPHATERTAAQHDPRAIDPVVAADRLDGFVHVRLAFEAIGVFTEPPHGMHLDEVTFVEVADPPSSPGIKPR